MIEKTCVVTGANSGIGKEVALGLAENGAQVVIIDRDDATETQQEIRTRFPQCHVVCFRADLSDPEQIKTVAEQINRSFDKIDVLVNNAGRHIVRREASVEGLEMNFSLNCLGGFRLTRLLLTSLEKANSARVVNVASEAHRLPGRFNFTDINTERESMLYAYGKSKYATIMLTRALARRLQVYSEEHAGHTKIEAFSVCPGLVATQIFNNFLPGWMASSFRQLTHLGLMATAEQAAHWPLQLALSTEETKQLVSGDFVTSHPLMRRIPKLKSLTDTGIQDQLWELCSELSQLPSDLD